MKIKDVFSHIFIGYNLTNSTTSTGYAEFYKYLQKDSIQYTSILSENLIEKKISSEIKKKYFLQPNDIVIYVKKPYRVGIHLQSDLPNIIIPNNFIILRGINEEYYHPVFVANYLEKIGLDKFVREEHHDGNISIDYLKLIELPDISIEEQLKVSSLFKAIHNRSVLYSKILANDEKIITYALNSIVGDQND